MKKLINLAIAMIFAMNCSIDAKQMVQKTIPVTKNTKQMFVDAKALKNAPTPEEKIAATEKLANDIKKNPYTQLDLYEKVLLEEIKELEDRIPQEESYISYYFDTEEVTADKKTLEEKY